MPLFTGDGITLPAKQHKFMLVHTTQADISCGIGLSVEKSIRNFNAFKFGVRFQNF